MAALTSGRRLIAALSSRRRLIAALSSRRRLLVAAGLVGVAGLVVVMVIALHGGGRKPPASRPVAHATPSAAPSVTSTPAPAIVPEVADLHGIAETRIPMRLQIPTRNIDIPLYAVGITSSGNLETPEGPADSPVWQQGFWYRGDVVPGAKGVAAIAGHVDDTIGRAGAFWRLHEMTVGEPVLILDERTNTLIHFHVVETDTYSLSQLAKTALLTRVFGPDAVSGASPGTTHDTQARLSLITCIGHFGRGGFDHRFVVYAVRDA